MHIHDVNKHGTLMVYCGEGRPPVANSIEGFGGGMFKTNPDIELSPSHIHTLADIEKAYEHMDDEELAHHARRALQIILADKIRRHAAGQNVTIFASEIEAACPHMMRMAHR